MPYCIDTAKLQRIIETGEGTEVEIRAIAGELKRAREELDRWHQALAMRMAQAQ